MLPNTNATLSRSQRWYTTFGLSVSVVFARPLVAVAISAPAAVKVPMMMLRRCIGSSIGPVKGEGAPVLHLRRMAASSFRSVTSDLHCSRLARSSLNTRSSAPPLSENPSSSGLLLCQMRMVSSRILVDLLSPASSTVMPPPSQIDRAIELRLVIGRQRLFDVTAVAAGVEVSGPVAERQPEPKRVVEGFILRELLGRDQKLHGVHLLERMPGEMRGVVQANEAGIGFFLLAGIAGKQSFGKAVVRAGSLGVGAGAGRGKDRDYRADRDRHE